MSKKDFYDKLKIVSDALKNISDAIKKHWKAILWIIAGISGLSGIAYKTLNQPVESDNVVCEHNAKVEVIAPTPVKSAPKLKPKTVIIEKCKCDNKSLERHVQKYHE